MGYLRVWNKKTIIASRTKEIKEKPWEYYSFINKQRRVRGKIENDDDCGFYLCEVLRSICLLLVQAVQIRFQVGNKKNG